MTYSTTWYHLDKNNKVITEYIEQACFAPIKYKIGILDNCQYLLYDFSNMQVSKAQAYKYFLYLKSIPEFKELMPRNCKQMADTMKYKVDVTKFNGTKIFTILTLIRAVVEYVAIVEAVIAFDRKHRYSLSNLCILKLCGSVHQKNSGHWLTMRISKENVAKAFASHLYWDDPTPCSKTGLGSNIFNTFNNNGDGYAPRSPLYQKDIDAVRNEKDKLKKQKVQKVKYNTQELQLGF